MPLIPASRSAPTTNGMSNAQALRSPARCWVAMGGEKRRSLPSGRSSVRRSGIVRPSTQSSGQRHQPLGIVAWASAADRVWFDGRDDGQFAAEPAGGGDRLELREFECFGVAAAVIVTPVDLISAATYAGQNGEWTSATKPVSRAHDGSTTTEAANEPVYP